MISRIGFNNNTAQNNKQMNFSGRLRCPGIDGIKPITNEKHDMGLIETFHCALKGIAGYSLKPAESQCDTAVFDVYEKNKGIVLRISNEGGVGIEFEHIGTVPSMATRFEAPEERSTSEFHLGYASRLFKEAQEKFGIKRLIPLPFLDL